MDIGGVYFFTDEGPDPVKFAQEMEAYGFESLYVPEHTHFPTSRKTPYPAAYGGGELPGFYLRTYDQAVTLSFIAASTKNLKIGTGALLAAQHDPISKAKQLATLDFLSDGRLTVAVGLGWNADEAEAHGVVWKQRFSIVKEKVAAMRALWRDEVASYEGKHVNLAPSWSWPKPKQQGGPAVFIGGAGPTTFKHAAEWADGLYIVPPPEDPTLEQTLPKFWEIVEESGRDPETMRVAVASAPPDAKVLEKYMEQGIERAVLWIDPSDPSQAFHNLEAAAKVLKEFQ
ncbi:LLM class F420-dependent oxidoreductase [Paenarthrobacter nicotinovorans]|uniref:LLM class F420-dependent oxidoreductase n=1 Tax=Paenarthrobacter nicotinovorans TaxID=29320 RepID=UPI003818B3A0